MRVLVIGLGSIAMKHLNVICSLYPEVEIFALRSKPNSSTINSIINIYQIDELDSKPDFILISNPTVHHIDAVEQTLHLGAPYFLEKPPVHDLSSLEKIERLHIDHNLKIYPAFNLRYLSGFDYILSQINNNKVFEVNVYCGSYLPDWRKGADYSKVYSSQKSLGGGVHLDLIHEIDYVQKLFGVPFRSTNWFKKNSTLYGDSFDYAHYVLEYESFVACITLNYFRREPKRVIEILTEEFTLDFNILKNEVYNRTTNELLYEGKDKVLDTYRKQMVHFIDNYIFSDQDMNYEFLRSLKVLRVALG